MDPQKVFQIMDVIANTISDTCTPQIIPNISFQNVKDTCIIIVEIAPGGNRPYYVKALGMEKGCFVRVAGTTRPADACKRKELQLEGTNQYFDEMLCIGYPVEEAAIHKLCKDIDLYHRKSKRTEEQEEQSSVASLCNLKLLKMQGEQLFATNAFVLLTSSYFPYAKIQCALFKGITRDVFIDKKEYTGSLYEQIDAAYQFVLRHMDLHVEIEGLIRKEQYEVPVSAIREMIINAVMHRCYMDSSCIQVAIFDDRIEVTSPGSLYGGLTLEEAMQGRSKIRNHAIAEVFSRMGIVETWGTGIQRILKRAQEYQLPKPEFIEFGDSFRVNFYRPTVQRVDRRPIEKADRKPIEKADRKQVQYQEILQYIEENGSITNAQARSLLQLAESTVKRICREMVEEELLLAQGERRHRVYKIKKS